MTGIIVTTPPAVELPPGNASGPATLPGVTYQYALLNLPQTWGGVQTFPLGTISVQWADVVGKDYTPAYFTQTGTGAVPYAVLSKIGQLFSVKDFGAIGDGTTDDYTAIMAAHAAAVAAGKGLFWPPGNYKTSTTLNFSNSNTRHVNLGGVTITFTGAGVAILIDGGASSGSLYDVGLGSRECPFKIVGNAAATIAVKVRAAHQCNINIIARNFVTAAMVINFSVSSKFYIKMSTNDGGAFTVQPSGALFTGLRNAGEYTTACEFEVIAEGISGTGVQLSNTQGCSFIGTSEGNVSGGGGVYEGTGCWLNRFNGYHCEANAGPDWTLAGSSMTLLSNCAAGSATGLLLQSAARAQIIGGQFTTISTDIGSSHCHFQNVNYTVSWSNASATTTWKDVFDGSAVYLADRYLNVSATARLIGRATAGAGFAEELSLGQAFTIAGTQLQTAAFTGDVTTPTNSLVTTLATVNSNTGTFGSATQSVQFTVNGKGLLTAAANVTIAPAIGSITGLGTSVATALGIAVGSAGAFTTFNGAHGTPSSIILTNATGTAASLTAGSATTTNQINSVDQTAALSTYTSTFSATTGTATVVAKQRAVGKLTFVNIDVLFTSVVTGTFTVTLPTTSVNAGFIPGIVQSNGIGAVGSMNASSNSVSVFTSAGAQITANASHVVLTGWYEAP